MPQLNKLTALKVTKETVPGRYADGGGLYLRVAEYDVMAGGTAISKNWVFRFERNGRERLMGLGSIDTLSLAEARERARECRKALLDGQDPIELRAAARAQAKAETARTMTFKDCAEIFIRTHSRSWKNPKHAAQWPSSLKTYVFPIIGDVVVSEVDTAMVVKCLEPIWSTKPETATRVRGRIERVLDWAKAFSHRGGDNPARWRGLLDKLLAAQPKGKRVRHHPALPYPELPAFMADIRERKDISVRALEFTVLTASRTIETIGALKTEFDFEAKLWTVPADRMKSKRPHIVPLCDRAIEIVRSVWSRSESDFLFPGAVDGKPLSDMAMLEVLRGMRPGFTVHGFRSTFRDWAGDRTNYQHDVVEAALAHVIVDETEAAYRRSTAVEKRKRLMADWGKYCASTPTKQSGQIISMQRSGS